MSASAKVLVLGSANIDEFFNVPHICKVGETISSTGYSRRAGGKGANQACSIAKAGTATDFAAHIGYDGQLVEETLAAAGVGLSCMKKLDILPTGRAVIQIDDKTKDNCIFLLPGANYAPTSPFPDDLSAYCLLVLQNEIPVEQTKKALIKAKSQHLVTMLNPSPIINDPYFPWRFVDWLVVNEAELWSLLRSLAPASFHLPDTLEQQMDVLLERYPDMTIVVTRGPDGVAFLSSNYRIHCPAGQLLGAVKDTTGAGDCFSGYLAALLAKSMQHLDRKRMQDILTIAQQAATMAVQKEGAMEAVPMLHNVRMEMRQDFVWPDWC